MCLTPEATTVLFIHLKYSKYLNEIWVKTSFPQDSSHFPFSYFLENAYKLLLLSWILCQILLFKELLLLRNTNSKSFKSSLKIGVTTCSFLSENKHRGSRVAICLVWQGYYILNCNQISNQMLNTYGTEQAF